MVASAKSVDCMVQLGTVVSSVAHSGLPVTTA